MQKKWALRAATLTLGAGAALGLAVGTANAASQINPNDTGSAVSCLQQGLDYVDGAGLNVDGVYGQATLGAVQHFQSEHSLEADGQVGPLTGGALKNAVQQDYSANVHAGQSDVAHTLAAWMNNCNSQIEG
ncbi:peptidoglycan-binding domain-containing protein [Kitasatospora sp. NPDC089797]|uniref:peptidoglycan-binding domain-containing protein n=1 Tax=Kitasatospora sp. NPDC089797 TaxID=3155298 RepID=UPI00343BC881